jgi:hypothetical protein
MFRAWTDSRAAGDNAFAVTESTDWPVSDRVVPWTAIQRKMFCMFSLGGGLIR